MEFDFPDPDFFIPYFDQFEYRQLKSRMSKQTDILDREPFNVIKEAILPRLQEIVDKSGYEGENLGVRITQSWCVKTSCDEYTPPHIHPNSQFSGVCYFNDSPSRIVLCRDDPWYMGATLRVFDSIDTDEFFMRTRNQYRYTPKAGKVIIFPSSMVHFVERSPQEYVGDRYSIAFNTFLTGKLLSDDTLASVTL